MRDGQIFDWLNTNGWLVLSGGADALSEIRAQALSRVDAEGAVAYISLAGDLGDSLMDDMADLGAPTGYLVDLEDSDNNAIYEQIRSASIIVIEPGQSIDKLKRLISQTVLHAMKEALDRGTLILLEGVAASLAGDLIVGDTGNIMNGLKWVNNAHIMTGVSSVLESASASKIYDYEPETIFIGIQLGSALVLGPHGHMETWGENEVTIGLGSGFDSE